jgi:malonate-semialdehyde dehydrogenase (acetylating)/methylmalonate-semialdehyde dehydrogenase
MPDANIHLVADGLVGAAFGSSGQRCMAISVAVVVGEKTADLLIEELKHRITELKIGSGIDPSIDMGPLITGSHLERVKQRVTQGVEQGAQLVVDGRCFHAKQYPQGFFMGACLFDHVTCNMDIYKDEIFGPVLCVLRVKTLEEAIEIINNNPYGNGTAIYTQQGDLARKFAANIQVGMVGINIPIPVPAAFFSFGGWKQSLFGDTHMYGTEGIHFYTRLKNITTRWPTQHVKGFELHMPTMK